jgi:hypothetical protein
MGRRAGIPLYVLALVVVVVAVDVLFFRRQFWERLLANIGIVLIFGAFYVRFLKPAWTEVDNVPRSDELPVACTLGATDGAARLARWRALSDARLNVQRTPDRVVVLYESRPDVHKELEALVAAERECCSFAEWELTRDSEHVALRVRSDAQGLAAIVGVLGLTATSAS